MIPVWMKEKDTYQPQAGGDNPYLKKTIKKIAQVILTIQQESPASLGFSMPVIPKLLLNLTAIVVISVSRNRLILLLLFAIVQSFLALYPGAFILRVLKRAVLMSLFTLLLLLPNMLLQPGGMSSNLRLVAKVFMTLELVHIFAGTISWNSLTRALRRLHVPAIVVFTLDITLKYIVLLGNMLLNMLEALKLRSVGKNNQKYQSLGGTLGSTFVRSTVLSQEMYEAMRCRGFTDDYRGL